MSDIHYFQKDLMKRFNKLNITLDTLVGKKNFSDSDKSHDDDAVSFEIHHINDFTSEQLKAENLKYEETGSLAVAPICAAYHGGPLDYPKVCWSQLIYLRKNAKFTYRL